MGKNYDVIVIGAGSIGIPATLSLSKDKKSALCIDSLHSPGQGNNKKAIGGVRATHSVYGKIKVCQKSIEIFSTWAEKYGDDIGWLSNGYSFPAYNKTIEYDLKEVLKTQKSFGLNIDWINAEEYQELIPGIETKGLLGATYSPEDGSCSPLLASNAMYFKSLEYGAEYKFNEIVLDINYQNSLFLVKTNKSLYFSKYLINASGNSAKEISNKLGFDVPVHPDSHEAAITEPIKRLFGPMIVDISEYKGSSNFYFYQYHDGPVIMCYTPSPLIYGTESNATSEFLHLCVERLLKIYPRLVNIKIRRQWRGQYPMTPDASPIIGYYPENRRFIQAVGMCGQGFMLGAGVGELLNRIVNDSLTDDDLEVLKSFDPKRAFSGIEAFL